MRPLPAIGFARHLAHDDSLIPVSLEAPSDLSRRINAERLVVLGWVRAVLLQLAHPLIAAGVAEHSSFRGSAVTALSRLHHTVGAMLALAFGGPAEHEQALEAIRTIHRRVHGVLDVGCGLFPAGTRYSAEDPELLLWVHVTLIESILLVYEQFISRLTDAERDAYCAESADIAVALGVPPNRVPRSWAAVREHLEGQYASGAIVVGDKARALAAALIAPSRSPVAWPLRWTLATLAAGLLPPEMRAQYGFAWSPRAGRRFDRLVGTLRRVRRFLPARVAHWKAARKRVSIATRLE